MNNHTISKEILEGKIEKVYVLHGTEMFLIKEFIQLIKRKSLDEATVDFNYSVYDMNETPIQIAIMDAETLPFMGDRRLVVIHNAYFLTGSKASTNIDHDLDTLQSYIKQPLETTSLIFVTATEKLDGRKKVVKLLQEKEKVLSFSPLKGRELLAWIVERAKKEEVKVEVSVAQLLGRLVGDDLLRLTQEIEKMTAYVGRGATITEDVVYKLASRTLEEDIFTLIDKTATLQMEQAIRIFYDLLKNKEEPLAILQLLARQFRMILQVKILLKKGYSQRQMASQLSVHPYPIKLAAEKSNQFNESALRSIIHYLSEEDFRIKSGQIDKVLSIELFLLNISKMIRVHAADKKKADLK